MGRRMTENQGAYRAVITTTHEAGSRLYPEGAIITAIKGPYATKAPALAAVTRAENEAAEDHDWSQGGNRTVVGRVETASAWTEVPR